MKIPNAKVGDLLPELSFGPVTRTMLALYAGASLDHNPIHIDSDFANCAAFGYIETRLTEARDTKETVIVDGNAVGVGIPRAAADAFGAQVPLGRGGTPEEAANGVYLLCAPESNYISGEVLVIGGGLTL